MYVIALLVLSVPIVTGQFSPGHGRALKPLSGQKLKIVTIFSEPYTLRAEDGGFEGFIPDLVSELAKRLGFEYELYETPDGRYGSSDPDTGAWNGMVGEVIDGQADMAAAPLTITSERNLVVDFVKPFQNLGLTLVAQKPKNSDELDSGWFFDFNVLKPFSAAVWIIVLITTVVISVALALHNKFNPYEWGEIYKRGFTNEGEKDVLSFSGSFWFVFTTLQWQGFERAPRSSGARLLLVFWFCFVTLTVVTYIGALVTHLWWASLVRPEMSTVHPIRNVADLVADDFKTYKVGTLPGGSTFRYIMDVAAPRKPEFERIKDYWLSEAGNDVLLTQTADLIEKARTENFMFFMETMSARYLVSRQCDLMTIGEQFAQRSYGFAVPINSNFTDYLHRGILDLEESGEIEALERKWWEGKGLCWNTTIPKQTKVASVAMGGAIPKVVDLRMYQGALVFLAIGVFLCLVITVAEILYFKHKGRLSESRRVHHQLSDHNEERPDIEHVE